MRSLLLPALLAVSFINLNAADAAQLKAAEQAYLKAGAAIVDQVNTKNVDVAKVEALVLETEKAAVILSHAYAEKFPAGKKLIDCIISNVATLDGSGNVTGLGPLKTASFKDLEENWHDGAYYKAHPEFGIDFSEEKNEHFTDPAHTMVHPMMVLQAAITYSKSHSAEDLKAMKEEMDEGMEQSTKLLETLTK